MKISNLAGDAMFAARRKYERFDKRYLPVFCIGDVKEVFDHADLKKGTLIGHLEVLGTGKNSYGCKIQILCVTLLDGTKVPATRVYTDDVAKSWNICQQFSFKAIKPEMSVYSQMF